jgi:hypothetical protein
VGSRNTHKNWTKFIGSCTPWKHHCPKTAASTFGTSHAALNILYVADNITIASFLASFYTLSVSASLEYVEYAGMLLLLYLTYSRMQTQITLKKTPKMTKLL